MASTLTRLLVHIVFSTKRRSPSIPREVEPDLHAYVGGTCRRMRSPLLAMGGTADHVHLLIDVSKTVTLADLMLNVKRDSSVWMSERAAWPGWQDGYAAFSIGASGVEALRSYIDGQEEHHRSIGFKDELRSLFERYSITWDEAYVWG